MDDILQKVRDAAEIALIDKSRRGEMIRVIRKLAASSEADTGPWSVLHDFVWDSAFYAPESSDPSYFGDERMDEELRTLLAGLEDAGES
jgi:hypothetical protein